MNHFCKLSLGLAFLVQACSACSNGGTPIPYSCICPDQFEGVNCLFRKCGPHGVSLGAHCKCDFGWRGVNCDIPKCKNGIYDLKYTWIEKHTFDPKCLCNPNWTGVFCDEIYCQNGQAVNKTFCACYYGFKGQNCELRDTKGKELILYFHVLLVLFGFVFCCLGCLSVRDVICKRTLHDGVVLQTAQNGIRMSYASTQHKSLERSIYEQAVSAR